MRYRALDDAGDMTFGNGRLDFLVDSREAVAQAAKTRLGLATGDWFLDLDEGTPYGTEVLGKTSRATYDRAIRDRVLGTEGVTEITEYSSVLQDRGLTVVARVDTQFGQVALGLRGFAPAVVPVPKQVSSLNFFDPDNSGLLPGL